jgi:hypothetical protein
MPKATVAADFDKALDVEVNLLTEITLQLVSFVDNLADTVYLLIRKVFNPCIGVNVGLPQYLLAQGRPNAI